MPASDSVSDSENEELNKITLQVGQVIKPLEDDDQDDFNDWPCYLLEDAVVYDKAAAHSSLLEVASKGPFTIEGRLSFEDEDELKLNLTRLDLENAHVKVDSVIQFSFGTRDNSADTGHVCMWGGVSRYGWFEISPSEAYAQTYARSTEAVNIYYFLLSFYKHKSAYSLPIEEILHRYASHEGSGRIRAEVEATIKSHADFLLNQMHVKEGVNFPKTVFYNWLAKSCPDVVKQLAKRNVDIIVPASVPKTASVPIPPPLSYDPDQEEQEPYEPAPGEVLNRTDPYHTEFDDPSSNPKILEEPPSHDIPAVIAWYLEFVRHDPHSKHVSYFRKGLQNIALKNTATMLYTDLTFKKYFTSSELLRLHASAIRAALPPAWHVSKLYQDLAHPELIPSKGPEFVAEAQKMTTLRRRGALPYQRGSGGQAVVQKRERKQAPARERSPGGTTGAYPLHFASRLSSSSDSRHGTPGSGSGTNVNANPNLAPISSRRTTNTSSKPEKLQAPAMTKAQVIQREKESNEAITSGEGVAPRPRGKVPARIPITIEVSAMDSGSETAEGRYNPRKRVHPDNEEPRFKSNRANNGKQSLPFPSLTRDPRSLDSEELNSDDDDDDEEEDEQGGINSEKEPIQLTLTSTIPSQSTSTSMKPRTTTTENDAPAQLLARESLLTGHQTPFLQRLIAEGRERLKEREEVIGSKAVPERIKGVMRDW